MTFLKIEDLSTCFISENGNPQVLRGVDLTVARGKRHALMGQTGAGKTVLALSIVKLLPDNAF